MACVFRSGHCGSEEENKAQPWVQEQFKNNKKRDDNTTTSRDLNLHFRVGSQERFSMNPTAKFEQAISIVLLPVSSQLAALHTSRTNSHSQYSCTRCGSDLTTSTRLVRSKRKRNACPSRAILASCSACGAKNSYPIEKNAATSSFPYGKQTMLLATPAHPVQVSGSSIVPPHIVPSTPFPPSAGQSSARKKKSSGLQEILQRNRDGERKRVKTAETNLSAFLTSL